MVRTALFGFYTVDLISTYFQSIAHPFGFVKTPWLLTYGSCNISEVVTISSESLCSGY
jgi:hypothetical protein